MRGAPPPLLDGLEQLAVSCTPGRLDLTARRVDFDGASTSFTVGLDTARGRSRSSRGRAARSALIGPGGCHVEPLEDTALRLIAPADTFATPMVAFDALVGRLPAGSAPATARLPDSRVS